MTNYVTGNSVTYILVLIWWKKSNFWGYKVKNLKFGDFPEMVNFGDPPRTEFYRYDHGDFAGK